MPHLIVEASLNVLPDSKVQALLDDLVFEFSAVPTVDSTAVKCRFCRYDRWSMGDQAPPEFLHCSIWVLQGRSGETLAEMSSSIFQYLRRRFQEEYERGWVAITVELREMDASTYRK